MSESGMEDEVEDSASAEIALPPSSCSVGSQLVRAFNEASGRWRMTVSPGSFIFMY